MLPSKYQEKQYVISLDSLDLLFLRQYVNKSNDQIMEQKLLWSLTEVESDSLLCEVELVSENDDHESSYIEPSQAVKCHICNIEVPQIYFKQHTKSLIHKNYMRLIEKVLENVSKQINVDMENISVKDQHDKFYCETCSEVILFANQRKHLRSNYHLKCKEAEEQIDTFIKIYTKCKFVSGTDAFNTTNETDNINMIERDKNYIDLELSTTSESNCNELDKDNGTNIEEISNSIPYNNNKFPYTKISDIEYDVKEYYTIKLQKLNLHDDINIITTKGYKEKTKMINFHSYIEHSSSLFCQLCDKWLGLNIEEHSTSEKHLFNVIQPINDDFIRVVEKNICHCVLCNTIIHTDSDQTDHVCINLSKSVSHACKDKSDVNIETDHNKYIDTHKFDKTSSKNNKESNPNKLDEDICIDYEDTSSKNRNKFDNSTINGNHISVDNSKYLQNLNDYNIQMTDFNATEMNCLVCNTNISKLNIVSHMKGIIHTNNLDSKLRKNKIKKLDNELYNCELCDTNVSNFINHINENLHIKNKVLSTKINKNYLIKYVYQDVSNDGPLARVYRDIYKDLLKENKIFKINNSSFNCVTCRIKMTRITEIHHVLGERHRIMKRECPIGGDTNSKKA